MTDQHGRPVMPIPRPAPGTLPKPPKPPTPEPPKPPAPATAITKDTPFRHTGGLSPDRVCEILADYPMASECREIHRAIKGQGLPLAQSFKESQYGKTARGNNPLGLMVPGSSPSRLMTFASWADAFREWQRRMDSPTYAGGVYMPESMTLERFIRVYVAGPGPGYANGESPESIALYLQQTIDRLNRYVGVEAPPAKPTPEPSGPITFGRVPRPENYDERIIAPGVNTAWNDLGPRKPRGIVLHRMLGTLAGTDSFFRGEARARACTDFGIGRGLVYRWTQPGANVAPWASGPADGIKGDGAAFWDRYKGDSVGVSIFNRDCESIEIEGAHYTDPVPDSDYQRLVELVAWRADAWLKIPWHRWPLNNDGVHCLLGHSEITAQKPCPGPVVYGLVPQLIDDVRQRLRSYQVLP